MIRIIVDSASDCRNGCFAYDALIPLSVSIGGQDYLDGVQLTSDQFYHLLETSTEFPKTSQPSPELFAEEFQKAAAAGDTVLCLCLSSALSGTYQSAVIAKNLVDYDEIYILDTKLVSHLIGVVADYASKLAKENLPIGEIISCCQDLIPRVRVFAGLETLEYLQKGGRLSRTSAAVGQLAGIKPIVTLTPDGEINGGLKAIGTPRAISTIISRMAGVELDPTFPVYTLYTNGTENTQMLEAKLLAAGISSAGRLQVGPTIGAHVGPGVYGVMFVVK